LDTTLSISQEFNRSLGAKELDVPDPYYGGPDGFENVFDIVERGCAGLLEHLVREHLPKR
jgi:protein-tyrosine phosphatase